MHHTRNKIVSLEHLDKSKPQGRALASAKLWVGSFSCASSAAALDTETAPEAMDVSARTRLPAVMACLNRPLR